jgi:hypothetical protein
MGPAPVVQDPGEMAVQRENEIHLGGSAEPPTDPAIHGEIPLTERSQLKSRFMRRL